MLRINFEHLRYFTLIFITFSVPSAPEFKFKKNSFILFLKKWTQKKSTTEEKTVE